MKRDIFSELIESVDALAEQRQSKITLRAHKVQLPKLVPITAEEVVAIRLQLNLSRSVFAMYPAHQHPNPRKLGTGTGNAKCPSHDTDPLG